MKTLCAACGAVNEHPFGMVVPCRQCGRLLPVVAPRGVAYALRMLAKPGFFVLLLVLWALVWPHMRTVKPEAGVNSSASGGNSLPAMRRLR